MENIAIQKADELSSDARRAVEQVLGRPLEHDEEVSIMAFSPHQAPTGGVRKKLARQLEARISKTSKRAQDVSPEEQEAAIDEALKHVRSTPK
jgi:hypothetical protein